MVEPWYIRAASSSTSETDEPSSSPSNQPSKDPSSSPSESSVSSQKSTMVNSNEHVTDSERQENSTEVKECSSTALLQDTVSPFSPDSRNPSDMDHLPPTSVSSSDSVRCRVCMCGVAEIGSNTTLITSQNISILANVADFDPPVLLRHVLCSHQISPYSVWDVPAGELWSTHMKVAYTSGSAFKAAPHARSVRAALTRVSCRQLTFTSTVCPCSTAAVRKTSGSALNRYEYAIAHVYDTSTIQFVLKCLSNRSQNRNGSTLDTN